MNYQTLFAPHLGKRVQAALIGVGEFGVSLLAQSQRIPNLHLSALCDRDVGRALQACRQAGLDEAQVRVCEDRGTAQRALQAGQRVIVADSELLMDLPLDIVVEATGQAAAAAANALRAIEHGKHVAMVSKEAESVVGPYLHDCARRAGLVYTPVDGDQPSLLIGLVSWARTLGLEIVAAGKSSEYDFVYDPQRKTVSWRERTLQTPDFAELWTLAPGVLERRSQRLRELPQRTVPDLCEMGVVVNATGLKPDTPSFHVPIARAVEVPEVFRPRSAGGILDKHAVIDVFNCLRRPDEASFAGGVFVVVACHDRGTWSVLKNKGIPVSRDGAYAMLYNPQHLLGVEAPLSILSACLLGYGTGASAARPVCDLAARAGRDFRAGDVLRITDAHHHEVAGLQPLLVDAAPLAGGSAVPYYLAVGCELVTDVAAGELLTCGMLKRPDDMDNRPSARLWALREAQDERFFGSSSLSPSDSSH